MTLYFAAPPLFAQGAAIEDQRYGPEGEMKWPALQDSINNAANIAFTVHAGDFKSGATECSNDLFAGRLRALRTTEASAGGRCA